MNTSTTFPAPTVLLRGSTDPTAPLVVLLHGRGADETGIIDLAGHFPDGVAYAAVRAPIAEGAGYAWFANRGIGRPIPESLEQTLGWFRAWLDEVAPAGRPVVVVGFSGGAAFAGGLILDDPARFAGAAILYGTLPFDAGVLTSAGRLASLPVFVAQGDNDHVIPGELQARTWAYLHGDSGAAASGHRDDSAHGLSGLALRALGGWLRQRLAYLDVRGPSSAGPSAATWPTLPGGVLPQRRGPAPEVSQQTPQQQLTQNAPAELQAQVFAHMSALAAVQVRPSVISVPGARAFTLGHDAAWGDDDSFIVRQAGEFAHIHPEYDGSLHVALPQPFAAAAIAAGWAVTHPLAGLHVPPGMVLLYGPRDAAELAVVVAILEAAHQFATTRDDD